MKFRRSACRSSRPSAFLSIVHAFLHGFCEQCGSEAPRRRDVSRETSAPRGRKRPQPRQAESRITWQMFPLRNLASLSAKTSALTLPNVDSGLCLMPS
jgi:hypothetical protein